MSSKLKSEILVSNNLQSSEHIDKFFDMFYAVFPQQRQLGNQFEKFTLASETQQLIVNPVINNSSIIAEIK